MAELKEIIVGVTVALRSPDGDIMERCQCVNIFVKNPNNKDEINRKVKEIVPDILDKWVWEIV